MSIEPLYEIVSKRFETIIQDKEEDKSYIERQARKEIAINNWKRSPIFGLGIAAFGKLWPSTPITHSHSGFTEILVSYGLIGLLSFYYTYIIILVTIIKGKLLYLQKVLFSFSFIFLLMENTTELFSSMYQMPFYILAVSICFMKKSCL